MISTNDWAAIAEAEAALAGIFAEIDRTATVNTKKVLDAFSKNRVSDTCFAGTTGYGYNDRGRETLEAVYRDIFGTESARVRTNFVNGTHAITCAVYGCCARRGTILSVTGRPYDTFATALGISGSAPGSFREEGYSYREVALLPDGEPDYAGIAASVRELTAAGELSCVILQRSRGYAQRPALSVADIGKIADAVRSENAEVPIFCDNCYGEFVDDTEPTQAGVDIVAGSLIKNIGGGISPCGGYIAGKSELVERAAARLSSPGIGGECGATLGVNRELFQGLFLAPHTTAQALKTAVFAAYVFEKAGFSVSPAWHERRFDIVQTITLGSPELVEKFCLGIQKSSPVDAFVTPKPWAMPGYECDVIMAAGAFIQGASIELSADSPMTPPYTVYMQGGLTYESGKLAALAAIGEMRDEAET
ncbi:MAG: methionine gamma-lyase family protein [Oscillospiraceae bacterium]|nr:methionine gamma-lyase family protein [Oscillospiraceae bacterium]